MSLSQGCERLQTDRGGAGRGIRREDERDGADHIGLGASALDSFASFSGRFLEPLRVEFYGGEHQRGSPHGHVAHVCRIAL